MSSMQLIKPHLIRIETLLREHQVWQQQPPTAQALQSDQPFCLDTLSPTEWLQWVLLPRFYQMIETDQPLPQSMVLTPYFEHSMESDSSIYSALMLTLQEFDQLFSADT